MNNVKSVVELAKRAASIATNAFLQKHGDADACGFAWVTVYEKGSTKLGRALLANGFTKAYGGGLQLWDPSDNATQSISAKEAGARAAADILKDELPRCTSRPELGVKVYANSRMD